MMSRWVGTFLSDGARSPETTTLSIPVLSPIPNQPPLMIGSDLVLDPPTPMQWLAIEEAVMQHYEKCQASDIANIDAAPIVAIMETDEIQERYARGGIKYATIAAVVGMSKPDKSNMIDLNDASSFIESLQRIGKDTLPSERRIRLVGIGRSNLRDFSYRVPTTVQIDMEDDEGYLKVSAYDENLQQRSENIITASFQMLRDGDYFSPSFQSPEQPAYGSPIHNLNRMSALANSIAHLHADRRKIVAGLQAAKARLQFAGAVDDIEDVDGLGAVFALKDSMLSDPGDKASTDEIVDKFLSEFPKPDYRLKETEVGVSQSDNYGMGFDSSSVSDIADLTRTWMTKLDPFYSPHTRSTETFYYEVLSFVSILSMENVLRSSDLVWSLRCTNTVERLTQAHDWMFTHRERLLERSEIAKGELLECGEKCTDFW